MNYDDWQLEYDLADCSKYINGDEILWMGKPVLNELNRREFILGVVMVIVALVSALLFRTLEACITGGMFVIFSFLFCGGTDTFTNARRKKTFYVITNQRIIRKQGLKIDYTHCWFHHNLEIISGENGQGTIKFLNLPIPKLRSYEWGKETELKNYFYIDNIPDVDYVVDLIRSLEKDALDK